MNLTSKISHAKINLRHKILRWRMQKPGAYNALSVLVLLCMTGAVVGLYFLFLTPKDTVTYADQFDVYIESYSFNGPVTAVTSNSFTMQGSIVEKADGINSVKNVTRTVNFSDKTSVYITTLNGKEVKSIVGSISDIIIGKNITVYGPNDPGNTPVLNATKLEIIQ